LRPGGYGDTTLLEQNPFYQKYKNNSAYFKYLVILIPCVLIALLPFIFQYTPLPELVGLSKDFTFSQLGLPIFGQINFFDFKTVDTGVFGPFGLGALIFGMFLPLGFALYFSFVFLSKTKELIKYRNDTLDLEREFNSSLFQLGNRLGNGVPPELVFGRVAESTEGLKTNDFFKRVNYNIAQMGMSVEGAIFDKSRGAIAYYPSELIATSMRILIESSKKGLNVAATSLMSISEYVKNMSKITDRLKDLLASIVSDMKSNMVFLAPLLSGVVVGLSVMIVQILNKLSLTGLAQGSALGGSFNFDTLLKIFEITKMIPPYYLQIAIGVYLVQIIFILTSTLVVIDSGQDPLEKMYRTALNLRAGIITYFVVALVSILVLSGLVSIVLSGI
jgi:hypothetical protein